MEKKGYVVLNHDEFYCFCFTKDEAYRYTTGTFANSPEFKIVEGEVRWEDDN